MHLVFTSKFRYQRVARMINGQDNLNRVEFKQTRVKVKTAAKNKSPRRWKLQ